MNTKLPNDKTEKSIQELYSENPNLVTIQKAAIALKVSKDTLRRWEAKGKISSIRTTSGYRLYDLKTLIKAAKSKPEAETPKPQYQSGPQIILPITAQTPLVGNSPEEHSYYGFANLNSEIVKLPTKTQPVVNESVKKVYDNSKFSQTRYSIKINSFGIRQNLKFYTIALVLTIILSGFLSTASVYLPGFNQTKPAKFIAGMFQKNPKDIKPSQEVALSNSKPEVLAASSIAKEGKFLQLNLDTNIVGNLAVEGEGVFTENLTAPNILYSLVAGNNISITGDTQNPTISSTVTLEDATSTTKGIASFSSDFFTVTAGAVSLTDGSITNTQIKDGTVSNTDLTNPSITINTAGSLTGGGSVSLGGSITLTGAASGVTSITGTSNQVIASASTGTITLSLPQDIATTSSPTLASLLLTGSTSGTLTLDTAATTTSYTLTLPGDDGTNGYVLQTDGSGNTSWVAQSGGASALQDAYDGGNTITTTTGRNIGFTLASGLASSTSLTLTNAGTANAFVLNDTNAATNTSIEIQSGGSPTLTITEAGTLSTSGNISTTSSGTITSASTLTASNGFTQTTGALSQTATSGSISATGLTAMTYTLSSGTAAVTAPTLNLNTSSTGNTSIGNATGTFALASNGGLNVTTGGALTGVASIDTIGVNATSLTFAGAGTISSTTISALTIDSGTTGTVNLGTGNNAKTLNIGTGTAGNTINLGTNNTVADAINIGSALDTTILAGTVRVSGLAVSSAVYTDASSNLTTTAPTSGGIGYWSRTGTTLSPTTSGDNVTTSGNISTTSTGTITSAGLLTASLGATISGATTSINASSNFATNINTGTSTGAVSIGNSAAGAIALSTGSTFGVTTTTSPQTYTSAVVTGTTTTSAFVFNASALTTGTALYLTSTATSGKLFDINATNTSGTISSIGYGASATLSGSLTAQEINLSAANLTATNQSVTGTAITIPTITNTITSGTKTLTGISIVTGNGSGINQNGAGGTTNFLGADITIPALTQTAGTLNAYGVQVTTPTTITTGGTAAGMNIVTTGVGAGSLYGLNVGSITGGAGTEYALNVGTGWDAVLRVGSTTVINGSGVTQVPGGGTGLSTVTQNGVVYGNAASNLGVTAAGTTGQVLIATTGSAPSWGSISGSTCTNCLVTDPAADQTIAPTGQGTTGLSVRQTSTASPTDDIFQVTNSAGTTKYFYVDKDGNVSTAGTSSQTLTLTPLTDTTALTLVGTNVTSQPLQYINSNNASATTGILNMAYGAAQTLTGSVIGFRQDLSTNVTATNQSVTGYQTTLPAATNTNTSGTVAYKGLTISGGALNANGTGGTTTYSGLDITIPALTQTLGTLTAYGANITTPSSITTGGTAYGYNVAASGVGAGSLYGLNISDITPGAGTEVGAQIGSGWDTNLLFNDTTTNVAVANGGTITIADSAGNSLCTITDAGTTGNLSCSGTIGGSGTVGFWSKSGTTLSPATANDIVSIANTTTTGADLGITNTGVYTGTGILNLTANSLTTGTAANITTNGLTTGNALSISSTSTAGGASGNSYLINLARSGANAQLAHTAYGMSSTVTNTNATSGTNIAGYFSASGATTANYGLLVAAGNVGLGLTTPAAQLDVLTPAATTGINLAGTAPASVATNGTSAATNTLLVVGTAGGASSGTTGQTGGTGGALSLTGGVGGAVAGASGIGGVGGVVSLTGGAGGNGAATGGAGGALTFTAGAAGTGGNANGGTLTLNSGAVTGSGTSTLNLGTSNATTVNLATATSATTLNIGAASTTAVTVAIAGGSADTGCTVAGATGNLTCTGNITGSSSGTVGFWSRTGTTLSPATSNDIVSITSNSATAALTLAPTGVTGTGLAISALSGTTANTGINIGAISGTGATGTGITVGNISTTGTNNYGLLLGTLTGGTSNNQQIATGAITATGSVINAQLNLGGVSGTANNSVNYGVLVGNISAAGTLTTNVGVGLGTLTGGTAANYQINTGVLTSATTTTNAQINLGGVVTTGGTTNYGINIGALSGTGTTNTALNITAATSTGTTTGIAVGALSGAGTTNTGISVGAVSGATTNNALTTAGGAVSFTDASNTVASLSLTNNTATTFGNGGNTAGVIDLQSTSLSTGNFMNIEVNGLTTGTGFNLSSSGTIASGGELMSLQATGITTGRILDISSAANTLTSGQLVSIVTSSSALTGSTTTGSLLQTSYTGTNGSTFVGNLNYFDYSPASAPTTSPTGDLMRLHLGANATNFAGNFFNLVDNTSSVFSASKTSFTTSLPSNFTAAGDVAIAYDINFTNPTASYIKSTAPLAIVAGETFNSSNLTLGTYNQGTIVLQTNNTTTTAVDLTSSTLTTGTGLAISTTGAGQTSGSLLTVTQSGTTTGYTGDVMRITGSGTTGAGASVLSLNGANTTEGSVLEVVGNTVTTTNGRVMTVSANALTSGIAVDITSSSSGVTSGNLLNIAQTGATTGITGAAVAMSTTASTNASARLLTLTANSMTVGKILTISGTGITSGQALQIDGSTTAGVTGNFVNIATDVGSAGSAINVAPDFSGSAVTSAGLKISATDSTANANTDRAFESNLTLTGNAAKTGVNIYANTSSSSTTADTLIGIYSSSNVSGIITTGTRNVYGIASKFDVGAESTGGTTNVYGIHSQTSADVGAGGTVNAYGIYVANGTYDTDGTSTAYGLYIAAISGADNNYGAYISSGVAIGDQASTSYGLEVYKNTATYAASITNIGNTTSALALNMRAGTDTSGTFVDFRRNDNTPVGSIQFSGGNTTAYNTTSDRRLKTDINQTHYGLEDLLNIEVNDYKFINDDGSTPHTGFIAQDLYNIYPEAVTVPTSDDRYWMVDYGKVTPLIVKSLQDLNYKVENALLTINPQGQADSLNAAKITVSGDVEVGGIVKASDYALNASEINRVGVLASLPVNQQNRASVADTLNLLAQAANEQESRIDELAEKEASTAAALADAQILGEQALTQTSTLQDSVASTSATIANLSSQIEELFASITGDSSPSTPSASSNPSPDLALTPPTVMFASDSATLDTLTVSSQATVSGQLTAYEGIFQNSLKSLGDTFLGKTNIAGDLSVDGTFSVTEGSKVNALPILYFQTSALAEAVDFFNGLVTITKDGAIAAKEIITEQISVKADSSAGTVVLTAGETEMPVMNDLVESDSIVILTSETPGAPSLAVADKVEDAGFVVKLSTPYTQDIKFSYLIVGQK